MDSLEVETAQAALDTRKFCTSPCGVYEGSEYQYPVVLNQTNKVASFINIEDMLFESFVDVVQSEEAGGENDKIALTQFVSALDNTGLRRTDPRLAETAGQLQVFRGRDQQEVDRAEFKQLILANIVLISRALRHQLVIPDFRSFTNIIDIIFEETAEVQEGVVASYIPQLAKIDPAKFGLSLATVDGQRHSRGHAEDKFTLQSVAKPLIYAIALNELGRDVVHRYVGMEPSGRKFNDMELDHNHQPHNPIVNAGSILTLALVQRLVRPELSNAAKFDYILAYFTKMAGGETIGFNNSVFLAEREHADRNFALSYQLKEHGCFPPGTNIKELLDLWYQLCSMEVSCEAVAVIAATLANGGTAPTTGLPVLRPEAVRDVLSLLHSCGFYESSGYFAFKVGIPGKSSVAGSMMMVLPNTMGVCLWSPPLDSYGNSCRGQAFMEALNVTFSFHRYEAGEAGAGAGKLQPTLAKRDPARGDTIVSLLYAAAAGDLDTLKTHHLLRHNMNASDYDGRTPLHLAAAEGHKECVVFLLYKCGVEPEPVDRWGFTPLSEAERFCHAPVTAVLAVWAGRGGDTLTSQSGQAMLQQMVTQPST